MVRNWFWISGLIFTQKYWRNIMKLFKRKSVVFVLLLFFTTAIQAIEIKLSPEEQMIPVGKQITISVSDAIGRITSLALKGQILASESYKVTYLAPDQPGTDVVTVMDSTGAATVIQTVILPQDEGILSAKNSSWEIFTSRNFVQAITLSDDSKTLWIGTQGGLEQRDAITGKLVRVLSTLDKLPSNNVTALFRDGNNGLFIGTLYGLVYLNSNAEGELLTARNQGKVITLFDLMLPIDLPIEQYCLYGILSPAQNEVFEAGEKKLWVMEEPKCLEVF